MINKKNILKKIKALEGKKIKNMQISIAPNINGKASNEGNAMATSQIGIKNIKAFFRGITEEQKQTLKTSQCMLTISIGQSYHERERFAATIELINNSFASCVLLIGDSLQRYTMALQSEQDLEHYHEMANEQGERWLERNEICYNKLAIPMRITRWDSWLNHPDFQQQKKKLEVLIDSDLLYKYTFTTAIDDYLNRYRERLSNPNEFDMDKAAKLCFNYVLEECAVLCLWPELGCQYEIYPALHNEAMQETRKRFIIPQYPELLRALTLRFRSANQRIYSN